MSDQTPGTPTRGQRVRLTAGIDIPGGWHTLASQDWERPHHLPAAIEGTVLGVREHGEKVVAEVHFLGYGIIADLPVTLLEALDG